MKKYKSRKVLYITVTVLATVAVVVLGIFIHHRFIGMSLVVEDIANSCSYENSGDVITSAASPHLKYEYIPNYEVDEYIEKARSEDRCIDRQ